MYTLLCNLWKDESGQDIAEYALMLAVVLAVAVAAAAALGTNATTVIQNAANKLT